jgi:Tat protein translocase TatB subunit
MFGIGLPELILLVIVALLVFDPKKLPDLARSLARVVASFRQATEEIRSSLDEETRRLRRELQEELPEAGRKKGEQEGPK